MFKHAALTLIAVKDLRISYSKKGDLPSLSFELDQATLVFITGSNGIGKSTFLKQLNGSIRSSKKIYISDKALEDYTLQEKAQRIGFLNQHHHVEFPLLVKELVVMGRYPYKSPLEPYSQEDFQDAWTILHELGIAYLYEKNVLTLSGGEQQLCFLAQLTLQDPDIILLDEPTQHLDLYNKAKIFQWMEKQVIEKGKIVLCVTHDLHWINTQHGFILNLNTLKNELQALNENLLQKIIEGLKRNDH